MIDPPDHHDPFESATDWEDIKTDESPKLSPPEYQRKLNTKKQHRAANKVSRQSRKKNRK